MTHTRSPQENARIAALTDSGAAAQGDDSGKAHIEPAPREPGTRWKPMNGSEYAFILEEDPDLAEGLSDEDRAAARRLFRAPVIYVSTPRWEPPQFDPMTTFGLLLLDGLVGRRVAVGRAVAMELLSCGDVLRPWDQPMRWDVIPAEFDWRIFRPARMAVLDQRITQLIGRRPELTVTFSSRLLRRSRHSAYLMAVTHLTRVEDRLLATLWHLASSWGRVTPQGVKLPFRLTHEVLGEIIGAKRPSVTVAIGELQQQERLARAGDGCYVLVGDPTDALPRASRTRQKS